MPKLKLLKKLKMFINKDSLSRAVFAHAVPKKGIYEKRVAVDVVADDFLWLGYAKHLEIRQRASDF